ncbi:hypothetical protein D3C76_1066300 [compost metagenome]
MTCFWIWNVRNRIARAFGVGFSRINQCGGLGEILWRGEDQHINFLLTQRRRQAHHPFKTVGTHHARFLIGEIAAREERRWRHVLIQNQHVRREDVRLFVDDTGQRQVQLTNVRRNAPGRDRAGNTRDIQLLAAGRKIGALSFRLVDRGPDQLLQR